MPVKWYSSLVLICVLGVALVVYSRYELQHPASPTPPAVGTHWYEALGIDICGKLQPHLPANPNASKSPVPGIRTDGDGVIQVAPTTSADAGANATLARFVQLYPGLVLSPSELKLPKGTRHLNGATCPAGTPDAHKAGQVAIKVWQSFTGTASNHPTIATNPSDVKLAAGQLITVAFVPAGATSSIPKPDATAITNLLNDQSGAASSSTTTPATTAPPATTTTAAGSTTTKPAATTTTKPAATTTTAKP
ncbi:MAG TPA: hypothetical protein VMB72_12205 [Acidimicrobiales bacterium]|nr:hypothetical protein [Acidimicrobiales bacterium]